MNTSISAVRHKLTPKAVAILSCGNSELSSHFDCIISWSLRISQQRRNAKRNGKCFPFLIKLIPADLKPSCSELKVEGFEALAKHKNGEAEAFCLTASTMAQNIYICMYVHIRWRYIYGEFRPEIQPEPTHCTGKKHICARYCFAFSSKLGTKSHL